MASGANGPMPVSLIAWKAVVRNTLRGFAAVRLGSALSIKDVAVHCSHGKRWAQLPSKPMLNADGSVMRNEAGKIRYVPLLEWLDKGAADRFSEGVIHAVEREYPGATDAEPQ